MLDGSRKRAEILTDRATACDVSGWQLAARALPVVLGLYQRGFLEVDPR